MNMLLMKNIDSLMDLVKTQTEDSHPGFIDRMLTSTSMISGEAMSGGLIELIIESTFSEIERRLDVHFLKVKSALQNEGISGDIIGKVVPILLQICARFGNIILILCVLLRFRSVSEMMNKLYVIGKKQKKLLKGAFARNGDLRHLNNGGDLRALTSKVHLLSTMVTLNYLD